MTWQEANARLERQIKALESASFMQDILVSVATHMSAFYDLRIFTDGQDVNHSQIGNYSVTSPKWATIEAFEVRHRGVFRPRLRMRRVSRGRSPGARGTPRTSIELNRGYNQLRAMQGFQVSKVDLDYSGGLRLSLQVGTVGNRVVFGSNNAEKGMIATAMERKFKKNIFGLSDTEIEEGENALVQAIDLILAKT